MVSKCRLSHLMPLIQLFLPSNSRSFPNHTKWFLLNGCNGWFLVDFYGSKEIAIFVDDDYARNGIPALDDELENTEDCSKMAFANPVWCRKHHWYAQYIIKSKLISPCVYGTSLWWNLLISSFSSGSLKLVLNSPLFFTFYFDRCIAYAFHNMKMTTFTHLYDHKYQRHESNTILWHPHKWPFFFAMIRKLNCQDNK